MRTTRECSGRSIPESCPSSWRYTSCKLWTRYVRPLSQNDEADRQGYTSVRLSLWSCQRHSSRRAPIFLVGRDRVSCSTNRATHHCLPPGQVSSWKIHGCHNLVLGNQSHLYDSSSQLQRIVGQSIIPGNIRSRCSTGIHLFDSDVVEKTRTASKTWLLGK